MTDPHETPTPEQSQDVDDDDLDEPDEHCQNLTVDGIAVRVQLPAGITLTDDDRNVFAALVRAAREHYEHDGVTVERVSISPDPQQLPLGNRVSEQP